MRGTRVGESIRPGSCLSPGQSKPGYSGRQIAAGTMTLDGIFAGAPTWREFRLQEI
tara:strand:- start:543 stop:710 length:168 start_codon:yes stop_codon:yes gene_type:complete